MSAPIRQIRLSFLSALLLACTIPSAVPANAQALRDSSLQTRITEKIDESSLATLQGNTHPLAQARFDRGPAPASMLAGRLLLVLARSTQQEANLQTYLQSVQDANSPNFRKFLSPVEFGERFGVDEADLQTIQNWLAGHGLTVGKVSKGHMAIEFSGTAGQVESTFHTSLRSYLINGEQHWANATDPQIPTALAPVVAGVTTLNSFHPKAQYIRGPSGVYDAKTHKITPTYTIGSATIGYYIFLGPADAATIYDTPTTLNANRTGTAYDGTGVTIGIAGDSNIDLTQNANYRATFGLAAKATTVVVDGSDPGENDDAVEAYLDTQVSGGIAPNASVVLYTAADTYYQSGLLLAIERAIDDNQADILNVSFIGCESALGAAANLYVSEIWEQAAAQGITVTVASGDSGSAACDKPNTETAAEQGLAVNGLGSTPYNISVGGTDYDILYSNFPISFAQYVDLTNSLANHRSALSYIPEEPWNDSTVGNTGIAQNEPISAETGDAQDNNIVAGGGGISTVYPVPAWQAGVASGTGRNLPDVSFLAGNGGSGALWGICTDLDSAGPDCAAGATGNSFNITGIGGTSAAAPAFAGILALEKQKAGSRLGQADYVLYDLAKSKYSAVFHDVTTGDNSVDCVATTNGCSENSAGYDFMTGYNATTGYDRASGLGSVDASQMLNDWANAGLVNSTSSLQLNGSTAALNITHGASVNVAADVSSTGGTPSGDISLVDSLSPASRPNSEGIADFALTSGSVSGTTNSLPGGTYTVSAHYGGSDTFGESDSNAIPVTVAAESSTTTLKVVAFFDPGTRNQATTPYYGFIYLIDAQPYGNSASAASPNAAATGTITFKDGGTTLGTAALSSEGVAEIQTIALTGGNNSLTAVFPGDASFLANTSSPSVFAVTPAVTVLAPPSTNQTTLTVGAPITFNTGFDSLDSFGAAPTGTVTFQSGNTILGTAPIVGMAGSPPTFASGTVTFTTSLLPAGTDSISATYNGDGNYAPSPISGATTITVNPTLSPMTVLPSSTTIKVNQPLQVTVTLAPVGSLPTPTGTVYITAEGSTTPIGYTSPTATLVHGSAVVTIPPNSLILGPETLTVQYSGDSYYYSSGTTQIQVNSSGTITPTVSVASPKGVVTGPIAMTFTASGPNGDPTPTGTVSIWDAASGDFYNQILPLVNGSATFSVQEGLGPGPNTITFTYLGDSNYIGATANAVVTVIANPNVSITPTSPTGAVNQPLSVTASIPDPLNVPIATGSIIFSSGTYTSAAIPLAGGSASVTIPANSLAVGTDPLLASYSGDTNYLPGSSNVFVIISAAPTPGLTVAGAAVSLEPGATTGNTSTITLTPSNGFTGSVTLTASITSSPAGAQDLPTFSFGATSPVSITGASAATATLTVFTTAPTTAALENRRHAESRWYSAGGAALACILLFGIPKRRRNLRHVLGMLTLLATLTCGVLACGGGSGGGAGGGGGTSNPGTTPGTYVVSVSGTSGTITATTTVNVTVQ